jgi:hypothetical protein
MQDSCIKAVPKIGYILAATVTPIPPDPPVLPVEWADDYDEDLTERIVEFGKELKALADRVEALLRVLRR